MTRRVAVLRPEPGNAATCARLAAMGFVPVALPLFHIVAREWNPPPAERFDALFLTSANAVRAAGAGIGQYRDLPLYAVGEATASCARAAGLNPVWTGKGDVADLRARAGAAGIARALHLCGADTAGPAGPPIACAMVVYENQVLPAKGDVQAAVRGSIVLIHSPRAGGRLAGLVEPSARGTTGLIAISRAAATAAGNGWGGVRVAAIPDEASMLAVLAAD